MFKVQWILGCMLLVSAQAMASSHVNCESQEGTYQFTMSAAAPDTSANGYVKSFSLKFYSNVNSSGPADLGQYSLTSESSQMRQGVYSDSTGVKLIVLGSFQGEVLDQGGSVKVIYHGTPEGFKVMKADGSTLAVSCKK